MATPSLDPTRTDSLSSTPLGMEEGQPLAAPDPYNPTQLLELFKRLKKESMDDRWNLEMEATRDLNYVGGRQWIVYNSSKRGWVDKRLQKWVPRPVTNKMAETLQAIRTNLAAISLAAKVTPVGKDPKAIAAAEVADQMMPMIHEEHDMNQVMREADFWLITTGSVVLQTSWDKDVRINRTFIPSEQCVACQAVYTPSEIVAANQTCPACGSTQFQPATDPMTGAPAGEWVAFGKGKTSALSLFEFAVPPNVTRFDEIPYIIRIRWRDKHWFEANRPDLVNKISWEKSPGDRSMQLFKALASGNETAASIQGHAFFTSPSTSVEGTTEYELWLKPTPDFPEGLVMRVVGDKSPLLLEVPEENLPGPFPYKDIRKNPIFPFLFSQYEHMGGRLLGRSALAPLIQKQDQLNQLDSLTQLCLTRMANPVWVVPEGAGVEHFSGEPGLVMKWNPLASGGTSAKPERIAGSEIPQSIMVLRDQIIKDIEELSGAFDIIKGQKPTGVEAFSALQLLVERSQSRFTAVFQSRGEMYRRWATIALELERQFGPQERTWAVVGPNRGYTFRQFQNAQLQGEISVQIEDGSNMPKTALGKRAAIEQANQLGLIDPADPDQKYALLSTFGLADLVPSLNYHVQSALQQQDAFERWADAPEGPPPLVVKPWFDAQVHWVERIKWLNTDHMRELLAARPELEQIILMHLQQLQFVINPPVAVGPDGQPVPAGQPAGAPPPSGQGSGGGGGMAMTNSNTNSGSIGSVPQGNAQTNQGMGPV